MTPLKVTRALIFKTLNRRTGLPPLGYNHVKMYTPYTNTVVTTSEVKRGNQFY